MFTELILLLVSAAPGPSEAGRMTATSESVVLERGASKYQANLGSALFAGDRLQTVARGGASFFLEEGHSINLGPLTSVTLQGRPGGWILRLDRGELLAVVGAMAGFTIETPSAQARVARGILRIRADSQHSRFWTEDGSAEVRSKTQKVVALSA